MSQNIFLIMLLSWIQHSKILQNLIIHIRSDHKHHQLAIFIMYQPSQDFSLCKLRCVKSTNKPGNRLPDYKTHTSRQKYRESHNRVCTNCLLYVGVVYRAIVGVHIHGDFHLPRKWQKKGKPWKIKHRDLYILGYTQTCWSLRCQ